MTTFKTKKLSFFTTCITISSLMLLWPSASFSNEPQDDDEVDQILTPEEMEPHSSKEEMEAVEATDDEPIKREEKLQKLPHDDQALATLSIADDHRNHRLHFSFEQSLNEALRLYSTVLEEKEISPDLKARSKINISKIYIKMAEYNLAKNIQTEYPQKVLALINSVLLEPSYSQDIKAWAKRFHAKLYLKGFYKDQISQEEAQKNAYALLHENLSTPNISAETRCRSRMQLAYGYLLHHFSAPNKKPIDLARALYNDVINDPEATADLRTKARLALATYSEFYKDTEPKLIQIQRFDLLNTALKEKKLSPTIAAQIKRIVAQNYLINAFDVPPIDAKRKARELMESAAQQIGLSDKLTVYYNIELGHHFLHAMFDLKPSESKKRALELYEDLPKTIYMTPDQKYEFVIALASYHIKNLFDFQTPEHSVEKALTLYNSLIEDPAYTPKQKADVKWLLANLYATHTLKPNQGEPTTAGMNLFTQILNDPNLSNEEKEYYKGNLRTLINNNAFGIPQTSALVAIMPNIS